MFFFFSFRCIRVLQPRSRMSLLQCTDDLLQQKAVQSSHYERLERQLLERERRRRAVMVALKQRTADVQRRTRDVVDLRRENAQLAEQLTQHALQLAALQCCSTEAQKTQKTTLERLQDGVRNWSGHPAQIVLIIQALQLQKKLNRGARALQRVLTSIWRLLQLRGQMRRFACCGDEMAQWHENHMNWLSQRLQERLLAAQQTREAALQAATAAQAECAGPLAAERQHITQTQYLLQAQAALLDVYNESLVVRCAAAQTGVVALASQVDAAAQERVTWEAKAEEATHALAARTRALLCQREAHAEVRTALVQKQHHLVAALAEVDATSAAVREGVCRITEETAAARQHGKVALLRILAVDVAWTLCESLRRRCAKQQAAQRAERVAAEQALALLRSQHADRLRNRQRARAAAAQHEEREALFRLEAQLRRAAVDLEEDEWRLVHAQMVRDACGAREKVAAAVAAAAAAARTATQRSHASLPEAKRAQKASRTRRPPSGRQSRGGADRSGFSAATAAAPAARTPVATRRQRAALEVVDALTLTASQTDSAAGGGVGVGERRRRASSASVSPPSSSITASHAPRAAYRLVSLKPSTAKKPPVTALSLPAPVAKAAKHAHATSAMSPFMATMSESDSSFSLMHDSALTDAAATAATNAPHRCCTNGSAGNRNTKDIHTNSRRAEESPAASEVRLSSLSPSPSPRRPLSRRRCTATSTIADTIKNDKTNTGQLICQTAALPRRPPRAAASSGVANETPRSALDAALLAARAPRPAAAGLASPLVRKLSATLGSVSALPVRGADGSSRRPAALPPPQGAAVITGGGRRRSSRAPLLMPTASGAADDLFADLFS